MRSTQPTSVEAVAEQFKRDIRGPASPFTELFPEVNQFFVSDILIDVLSCIFPDGQIPRRSSLDEASRKWMKRKPGSLEIRMKPPLREAIAEHGPIECSTEDLSRLMRWMNERVHFLLYRDFVLYNAEMILHFANIYKPKGRWNFNAFPSLKEINQGQAGFLSHLTIMQFTREPEAWLEAQVLPLMPNSWRKLYSRKLHSGRIRLLASPESSKRVQSARMEQQGLLETVWDLKDTLRRLGLSEAECRHVTEGITCEGKRRSIDDIAQRLGEPMGPIGLSIEKACDLLQQAGQDDRDCQALLEWYLDMNFHLESPVLPIPTPIERFAPQVIRFLKKVRNLLKDDEYQALRAMITPRGNRREHYVALTHFEGDLVAFNTALEGIETTLQKHPELWNWYTNRDFDLGNGVVLPLEILTKQRAAL